MRNILKWVKENKMVAIDYIAENYVSATYQESFEYSEENEAHTLTFMMYNGKVSVEDGATELGEFKTQKSAIEFVEKYLSFFTNIVEYTQEQKDVRMSNLLFMKEYVSKKEAEKEAQATKEIEKELNELAPAVKEVAKNSLEVTYKNLDNKKEVTIEITENGFVFGNREVGFDEVGINAVVSHILVCVTNVLDKWFESDEDENERKSVFKSVVSDRENNRTYNGECVETKDGYEIEIEFDEFNEKHYCFIEFDEIGNVTKILFSGTHTPKAIRGEFISKLRSMLARKVVA